MVVRGFLALGLMSVIVGCATPSAGGDPPRPAPHGTMALVSPGAVTVVRDGVVGATAEGVVALDGDAIVTTSVTGKRTQVGWRDLETGAITASQVVAGEFAAVTTDRSGVLVALAPPQGDTPDGQIAPGRASTEIVVVSRFRGEVGRWRLAGNLVPEGFGSVEQPDAVPPLFVVEYLPPEQPEVYGVRWLDTEAGKLNLPLNLRTKNAVDQKMAGVSRTSVYSSVHDLLFTLYRGINGDHHTGGYAFVHTLGFNSGVWCLAVPDAMDVALATGGIGMTADQSRVVVASGNGMVGSYEVAAMLDGERRPVMDRVVDVDVTTGAAPVIAARGDGIWVALGQVVVEFDAETLTERSRIGAPLTVEGLTVLDDGALLVAGDDRLVRLDGTGRVVADMAAPIADPVTSLITA